MFLDQSLDNLFVGGLAATILLCRKKTTTITKELEVSAKSLCKTKDIQERKVISDTIRNLAESLRCFTDMSETMMDMSEMNDAFEDDDEPLRF